MAVRHARTWVFCVFVAMLLPTLGMAQSFTGTLSGTVMDPSGAVIPNAEVTLALVATGTTARVATGPDGLYSFPNLRPALYELKVSAPGFRDYIQRGVEVAIAQTARQDVTLQLGAAVQTVEVTAAASPLKVETSEVEGGITPTVLRELPLMVAGGVRSSASFAILMPGVSIGAGGSPFDARINGGLQTGDEAVMDGASMQQGMMNQTGMISIYQDFPMTPDMVSELRVLTSSYAPEYGSSLSGQIVVESRAGTNEYHASVFDYHRNTVLNARQFGVAKRPPDLEHDWGWNVGGPVKFGKYGIPLFSRGRKKSYFYLNLESFRQAGGVSAPIYTVPTVKMKNGDFSEWPYPIYDPATTRPKDPNQPLSVTNFTRDQFMGCDPVNNPQPNVICPTRFADSIALKWLQYAPDPNRPGYTYANNYIVPKPVPDVLISNVQYVLFRGDQYIGDNDHVSVTVWYQGARQNLVTEMPVEIATETYTDPQFSFVDRIRWDHTFSPTVLNHFGFGYLDRNEGYGSINWLLAPNALPRIPGVASQEYPGVIDFSDGYYSYGQGNGAGPPNRTTRQTYIFLDTLTWVKGKHTFKFGGEFRDLAQNIRDWVDAGGNFDFARGQTGLYGITSGHPIASFLLERADYAYVPFRAIGARYPRSHYYILHGGDTWKVSPKLSINYGVRWDTMTPAFELYDHHSFFDPLGANPGAGGRPGRLAFAGTKSLATGLSYGDAAYGRRHPEETWWGGFAPRLGIAYSFDPKTVIRAGYGVFFTQAFYPGWSSSIATDGFTGTVTRSAKLGGYEPALILSQGFADIQPEELPPFIDSAYRNGRGLQYKPLDANRRSYSQQWNLTIERQFGTDFTLSAAYVGSKGTRLPSREARLNALDPKLLGQYGEDLLDEFAEGQTELHGVPIPYAGWREQMTCSPTLAQALLPYPQYCDGLQGLNENAGNSTYHSLQVKAEKRFAAGTFLLASYTLSKLLGSSDQTQIDAMTWNAVSGVISPFERQRNKALAVDDVPQILSVSLVYELPFGRGKRYLDTGGAANKLVGGWSLTSLFRATSGIPFFFRSGTCNVPWQFAVSCIPGIKPGAYPWAQGKGTFDPNRPLFNRDAFEPLSGFEAFGYYGQGPRISNLRGFGYHNQNVGIVKDTRITERINFQIRAEFFNVWNWHIFSTSGTWGDSSFNTWIDSGDFGMWNGRVSTPRNIQIGARLEF